MKFHLAHCNVKFLLRSPATPKSESRTQVSGDFSGKKTEKDENSSPNKVVNDVTDDVRTPEKAMDVKRRKLNDDEVEESPSKVCITPGNRNCLLYSYQMTNMVKFHNKNE